jgi:hypothetical protein
MVEDERCCGIGTCMINAEGFCWCGQQWDGQTMCRPGSAVQAEDLPESVDPVTLPPPGA